MTENAPQGRRLLVGLMIAVGLWGGILALGAFLFGYDDTSGEMHLSPNPVRGLIVLGCVAGFLAVWGVLLRGRRAVVR